MTVDEMTVDEMTVDELTVDENSCCPPQHSRIAFLSEGSEIKTFLFNFDSIGFYGNCAENA